MNGYIYMGSVAGGTVCTDGVIGRVNSGPCDQNGAIVCGDGGRTFFLCDHWGLVDMGKVADGTVCVDGAIIAG